MKKAVIAILSAACLMLTFIFAACSNSQGGGNNGGNATASPEQPENKDNEKPDEQTGSEILIAYFSWSETTTRLAMHVKAQIPSASLYRIERETPYSTNYNEVAYGEAKDEADGNARPPVKNPVSAADMSMYDKVVIMYPIWWHTAPMVVGTFLETYDLSGVDVYPITQSASMNVSQFNESFAFVKSCAKNATVHDGLGTKSTDAIDNYLRANGLLA